jgi:outer membrane biosynthesis protein TonB
MSMRPDIELPDPEQECPPDVLAMIEEHHQGLHRILVSRRKPNGGHETFGTIVCQKTKDRFGRPEATPEELGDLVMMWIQYDIYRTDDPGNYRVLLVGPPGKGKFERSTHINMMGEGGVPRTMAMLNQGDLLEAQTLYIGEMHSQVIGMIEIVIGGYKTVVNENREMMKILSEATRKHGEIEAMRLEHQLNMKIHEDDKQHQEAEAERSQKKWEQGLATLKDTGAAEDLMRAIAKRIQGAKEAREAARSVDEAKPPTEEPVAEPTEKEAPKRTRFAQGKKKSSKKKSTKKKSSKKKSTKKSTKKSSKKEEPPEEEGLDEFLEEGAQLLGENPLVLAAETLKMTINQKGQWGIIRKTLTEEQADILDDIFASTTDAEVKKNAQRLAKAKGMLKLIDLNKHLDEQQRAFIGLVMGEVEVS